MSKAKKKPAYQLHKGTGQARVRINGQDHWLGNYGSPESRERYDDLISEWFVTHSVERSLLTVDDLVLQFMLHAEAYYRKDGLPTSEIHCFRLAFRRLIEEYGPTRAMDFGPRSLKKVRQQMVSDGFVRGTINGLIGRIRRLFKWAASEELLPKDIWQGLLTVDGLRGGRSDAVESDPIEPVEIERVHATLPYLSTPVANMVRLQLLTGTRPGEIVILRPCDVTTGTDGVWTYRPSSHKTQHHRRERRIFFGPEAQSILRPYLARDSETYCFSPAEAMGELNATKRKNRKSRPTPSQLARTPLDDPEWKAGDRYTRDSYRRAVCRACEIAFEMPDKLRKTPKKEEAGAKAMRLKEATGWRELHCWHPNQLRHTQATVVRAKFGIEAAQMVLGHSKTDMTEIYAERDFEKAAEVMKQIG